MIDNTGYFLSDLQMKDDDQVIVIGVPVGQEIIAVYKDYDVVETKPDKDIEFDHTRPTAAVNVRSEIYGVVTPNRKFVALENLSAPTDYGCNLGWLMRTGFKIPVHVKVPFGSLNEEVLEKMFVRFSEASDEELKTLMVRVQCRNKKYYLEKAGKCFRVAMV